MSLYDSGMVIWHWIGAFFLFVALPIMAIVGLGHLIKEIIGWWIGRKSDRFFILLNGALWIAVVGVFLWGFIKAP